MVRVSPDGQFAVFDARDEDFDIGMWDFKRPRMERVTSQPDSEFVPRLEPEREPAALLELGTGRRAGVVPDGFAACPRAAHKKRRSAAVTYDHHPRREMAGRLARSFCA